MGEVVWFRHPHLCWASGRIVEYSGTHITVNDSVSLAAAGGGAEGANYVVLKSDVHPVDPSHFKNLSDIAFMNNMHEGACRLAAYFY